MGVLDSQAAILVWDQCFLQMWNASVLEDTCLALLLLLRHKFMAARNYADMREVSCFTSVLFELSQSYLTAMRFCFT